MLQRLNKVNCANLKLIKKEKNENVYLKITDEMDLQSTVVNQKYHDNTLKKEGHLKLRPCVETPKENLQTFKQT